MNRPYTMKRYMEIVDHIRTRDPDIAKGNGYNSRFPVKRMMIRRERSKLSGKPDSLMSPVQLFAAYRHAGGYGRLLRRARGGEARQPCFGDPPGYWGF